MYESRCQSNSLCAKELHPSNLELSKSDRGAAQGCAEGGSLDGAWHFGADLEGLETGVKLHKESGAETYNNARSVNNSPTVFLLNHNMNEHIALHECDIYRYTVGGNYSA